VKKDFYKMLDTSTKDRTALVVLNKEQDGIVADRFKRFKAIDPGPFLLGCREYWMDAQDVNDSKLQRSADIFQAPRFG